MANHLAPNDPVVVTPKPWWESKTVWFNGLTMLVVFLALIMQMSDAGTLPFPVDPKWIVFLQAIINLILRFVTNAPVTASKT